VSIIVHNCRTQHSTEQLSSLLSSRKASELRCCLLEGGWSNSNDK